VITAAAAIMVVVFGAFVLNDEVIAKLAGLGLATAVFLDATLVRMVLVPATMELLGERNWWMPALARPRRLPRRLRHRRPVRERPLVALPETRDGVTWSTRLTRCWSCSYNQHSAMRSRGERSARATTCGPADRIDSRTKIAPAR
jgi:hypothetical protein